MPRTSGGVSGVEHKVGPQYKFEAKCKCRHMRSTHFASAGRCSVKIVEREGSTSPPFTEEVKDGCLKLCQRFEYDPE